MTVRPLTLAMTLALGTLGAGLGLPGEAPGQDRELVIGITQYPATLHPNIDTMAAKSYVLGLVRRPITQYDADWELTCHLCVKLPSIEDGDAVVIPKDDAPDGVKLTYTIDEDAVWGDGTPVTTEDVLFTWEVGRHPQSGVSNAELYRRILDIEVHDDKTFTLTNEKLSFDYAAINDFRLLPAHLERERFEADPATYRNRTRYDTEPTEPGLWMGPYRVTEVNPGSHIVVARNPHWWGEEPWFERIIVRTIENTSALEANLLSGEIDMIDGALGLSLDQAIAFEGRHGDRFEVVYKPGLIYEHIDLMLENPILADRRVRQALLYSLDREALTEQLFDGRQPVAHSNVSPLDWVHHEDVPQYERDLEAAGQLLDEAGWSTLRNGVRHNEAGEPLELELMTTAGNRTRELVQQVLQSMWKEAGIDVRINNEPARVLFGETISRRRFRHMAMFAWISSPENVPRSTLHSEEIPSAENGWSGQNYTGFRNERMDELIDAIEVELDREKRRAMWAELQEIYARELPALPLYFRADPHVWPDWLEGVEPTGHLAPTTLNAERWRAAGDG